MVKYCQIKVSDIETTVRRFLKIDVLSNIHRKTPVLESLFNKVAGLKMRLQHKHFSVNIAKFFRTAFFYKTALVVASADKSCNCC